MRTALICFASIVLGFLFMAPLGMLFDAMNWQLFHTWGLAHGSFLFAWPLLTLTSFIVITAFRLARKTRKKIEPEAGE
jgi:hypothetical protein